MKLNKNSRDKNGNPFFKGKNNKVTIVLDTTSFIAGYDPLSIREVQYSVPEVRIELFPSSLPRTRFDVAVENGKLIVKEPENVYVDKVKEASRVMGDSAFLSIADQKILALALQLKDLSLNPRIFTDDYSIQNVADKICIGFAPLLTLGIRYRFRWTIYCPACYQRYSADYGSQNCQICGTKLKRKPIRKKLI